MIPESLIRAAADTRLHARDLAVYVYLHKLLDYHDFTPIKGTWLARQIGLDRGNLGHSLTRLVDLGYVCRQREGNGVQGLIASYRIPLSPRTRADDTAVPIPTAPDSRTQSTNA